MRHVDVARSLINVPWLHQGRDAKVGIDCVGLLVLAFEITGPVPDYGRDPHDGLLERHLREQFGDPHAADPRVGDVVAMAYSGAVRHVGIVGNYLYGGHSLIHTDSHLGRVTEHPLDGKWLRRVRGVYRP
jgi:cell wall-associated NlpC family hydrolase